jgi:hypothetical protein
MFAEEKVKSILLPVLREEGYDLVSVRYLRSRAMVPNFKSWSIGIRRSVSMIS